MDFSQELLDSITIIEAKEVIKMSVEVGRLVNVGFAKEGSRGTPEASATFWVPRVDFDFNPRVDYAVENAGLGVIDSRSDAKVVEKVGEGSIGGVVYDESFGLLLAACLGTWSSSTAVDHAYTHSFTRLNSNQHPSLTIFHDDGIVDERFALGMLNNLTINCVVKDFVKYSAGFMSKIGADTSSSPSYSDEDVFLGTHVTVKFAATIAALGAASATPVRAFNITINKNVEDLMELGDDDPADIVNKALAVSGDLEATFENETIRDYVLDGSKKACLVTIENTDVTIGNGSTNPKLEITLAPMSFRDWGRGAGLDDVMTQTVSFDGNFSLDDAKTVSIELVNGNASY